MKSATPIRIILADDHEIFRDGFKVMIKKQPSVQLVAEASNGEELIALTKEHKPKHFNNNFVSKKHNYCNTNEKSGIF